MLNRKKKRLSASNSSIKPSTTNRTNNKSEISTLDDTNYNSSNDANIMTRKPIRIRKPRNTFLQSGYCAICNLPYNSVEDHIQSKKHQKLIGHDTTFIALNDYLQCDIGIEPLLNLAGIDAIGFDNFALSKMKRRNMPRSKSSINAANTKSSSATMVENNKPRLRSRKNIKYVSPQPEQHETEKQSFEEKSPIEPARIQYKEYRELRSSTRALAKLTSIQNTVADDVWDSGRPKRACINKSKRLSSDDNQHLSATDQKPVGCKTESISSSNKMKLTTNSTRDVKETSTKSLQNKFNSKDDDCNARFRKLRSSELIQLNNEATNFLFPKRDESSDDDDDDDDEEEETENVEDQKELLDKKIHNKKHNKEKKHQDKKKNIEFNTAKSSTSTLKCKIEEDSGSMDSSNSFDIKKKKKRRSHAEAFIMDNQKYYKFETPCSSNSRLRYHGSYLSPIPTKSNGDCVTTKTEKKVTVSPAVTTTTAAAAAVVEKPAEKVPEKPKSHFDDYTFSFEMVPVNQSWYKTFQRHDRSEERYNFGHNYFWDDFVLPSQMPHLKPLDPKVCIHAYHTIRNEIQKRHKEKQQQSTSSTATEEEKQQQQQQQPGTSETESPNNPAVSENESTTVPPEQTDEQPKQSQEDNHNTSNPTIESDTPNNTEVKSPSCERRKFTRKKKHLGPSPPAAAAIGRNPRKSPRQHASTLAILSSLTHQRKRRSKTAVSSSDTSLQPIPEESLIENKRTSTASGSTATVSPPPQKVKKKRKEDFFALAAQIDAQLTQDVDSILNNYDLEPCIDPDFVRVKESRLNVDDIMTLYEQSKIQQSCERAQRRSAHLQGRKPGKRKKNKTGWPNKVKRKKVSSKDDVSGGSGSGNGVETTERLESDDADDNDEEKDDSSDSIIDGSDGNHNHENNKKVASDLVVIDNNVNKIAIDNSRVVEDTECDIRDNKHDDDNNKQQSTNVLCVKKHVNNSSANRSSNKTRTVTKTQQGQKNKKTSPRALRKPRGRWYRER